MDASVPDAKNLEGLAPADAAPKLFTPLFSDEVALTTALYNLHPLHPPSARRPAQGPRAARAGACEGGPRGEGSHLNLS